MATPAVEPSVIESGLDSTNNYISTKWDQINRNVDLFFTNQETKENDSSIFIYSSFYKKEGAPLEKDYDFQFKISLPNTTKNLKIIVEKQQDDIANALSDTSVTSNRLISKDGKVSTKKKGNYTAGAKFDLKKDKSFTTTFNFGIRLDVPLNPYGKLEFKKDIKTNFVNIWLSQKFLLYRQEGFQELTQASFVKKINRDFQADFTHVLTWTDESDVFTLRHSFVLTQKLSQRKTLSYSVGANATFKPTYYYDKYDTSVSYTQLLHKDWFYATATVGMDFYKTNNFNDEKFAQIRFDIYFK